MRVSISVSIGHEPVMIQPASTTAFKMASQLAVVLLAKTIVADTFGPKNAPTFANAFAKLSLIKCNILLRLAEFVRTINHDFRIFRNFRSAKQVGMDSDDRSRRNQT